MQSKAEVSMYLHTECAHKLLSCEQSAQKFILLLSEVTKYRNSFLLNTETLFFKKKNILNLPLNKTLHSVTPQLHSLPSM